MYTPTLVFETYNSLSLRFHATVNEALDVACSAAKNRTSEQILRDAFVCSYLCRVLWPLMLSCRFVTDENPHFYSFSALLSTSPRLKGLGGR